MIFRRGMLTAGAGLAAGLAAAYALARLMASLVWGVTATDPATCPAANRLPRSWWPAAALAIYIPAAAGEAYRPIVGFAL